MGESGHFLHMPSIPQASTPATPSHFAVAAPGLIPFQLAIGVHVTGKCQPLSCWSDLAKRKQGMDFVQNI
jgi:hypothetical protein